MEEKVAISQQSASKRSTANSSKGWMVFWLIFFMLIGLAGTGYYLDLRLASFEEKVLTQTTESTLIALQETRKEVLGNRRESAAFAQKFSDTLKDVSALLTQTVNAFSEQTLQLTKAIEKKDKNQAEYLQTAMADISKEMTSTRQAALEAKTKTDSIEKQLVALSGQLQEVSGDLASGFTTLTQLSEKMSQVVAVSLDEKTRALNGQLMDLRNASQQSLESVEQKLIDIDNSIQDTSSRDSLARHIDAAVDVMNAGFTDQRNTASSIQSSMSNTEQISQTVSGISKQLEILAEDMQVSFAEGEGELEALQSDVSEMSYNLDGRMDDLLVGLADSGNNENSLTLENLAGIEGRLNSLSGNFQLLRSDLGNQLSDAIRAANLSSQDVKLQQTAAHLKNLGQNIQNLQQSVQTRIESAQTKASKWIDAPESQEARDAFQAEIMEFTKLIESTCNQVENIQKQISGLAGQLELPPEDSPIGMIPIQAESVSQ